MTLGQVFVHVPHQAHSSVEYYFTVLATGLSVCYQGMRATLHGETLPATCLQFVPLVLLRQLFQIVSRK
jgi:hypothetical protein